MNEATAISINVNSIAKELLKKGYKEVTGGWSNDLLDILEDKYSLETKVVKALKEVSLKQKKDQNFSMRMPQELRDTLSRIAKINKKPDATIVRQALEEYLKKEETNNQ